MRFSMHCHHRGETYESYTVLQDLIEGITLLENAFNQTLTLSSSNNNNNNTNTNN